MLVRPGFVGRIGGLSAHHGGAVALPTDGLVSVYEADSSSNFTLSTGLVDQWDDESGSNNLTGTTTSRPTYSGDLYGGVVTFDGGDHLVVPAGVSLDRQSFSVFVVTRGPKPSTFQTYFCLDTTPDLALYQDALGQLVVRDTAANNSGIFWGYERPGPNVAYAIGSASTAKIGHATAEYDKGTPLAAGTESGGYVGVWGNGSSFPLVASTDILAMYVYNVALSDSEKNQVLDYCTNKWKSLNRSSASSFLVQGDSLSDGEQSTDNFDYSWPAQLGRLHSFAPLIDNQAAGGRKMQDVVLGAEESSWLTRNSSYTNRIVTVWLGTNDISAGRTSAQLIADYDSYLAVIRAADSGAKIVACTIIPRGPFNPTQDGYIDDTNTHIKTTADVDLVVDLAAKPELDDPTDATYFDADQVHLNDAGYASVAGYIRAAYISQGWL